MIKNRRNEYDVSNKVKVTSIAQVRDAVLLLAKDQYKDDADLNQIAQLFSLFHDLFHGDKTGFMSYDTVYHDIQHTLDVTLCTARHVIGHDKKESNKLGYNYFLVAINTALFHDSGYIRKINEEPTNGAVFTKTHVSRSSDFIVEYTSDIVGNNIAKTCGNIVHFTGYEVKCEDIVTQSPEEKLVGEMVATADILAQMSDRCYVEKCRDRLYPEFVLAGMNVSTDQNKKFIVYKSATEMLVKTPEFYRITTKPRLDNILNKAYLHLDNYFTLGNPYLEAIKSNIEHLENAIEKNDLGLLRRRPPKNKALEHFPFDEVYNKEKLLSIQSLIDTPAEGDTSYSNFV